jgi:hypothetical protein
VVVEAMFDSREGEEERRKKEKNNYKEGIMDGRMESDLQMLWAVHCSLLLSHAALHFCLVPGRK